MNGALTVLFGAIAALGGITGLVSWRRVRAQNRLDNATAENTEADAVKKWQQLYDDLQERVEAMEGQAAALRDLARGAEASAAAARLEAQRARTEKAEAETRVAELEAELARSIASASEERHALRGEFEEYMRRMEVERLHERQKYEQRIAQLEARVEALSVSQAGGRRADDKN